MCVTLFRIFVADKEMGMTFVLQLNVHKLRNQENFHSSNNDLCKENKENVYIFTMDTTNFGKVWLKNNDKNNSQGYRMNIRMPEKCLMSKVKENEMSPIMHISANSLFVIRKECNYTGINNL